MKTYIYEQTPIRTIEYWYDATRNGGRSWWARVIDLEGNQIGDAEFCHAKADILIACKRLRDEQRVSA